MRRVVGLVLLGLALGPALSGCGQGAFQRELAVRFNHAPGSTRPDPAQVLAVRKACPGISTVILEPAIDVATAKLSEAVNPIRYDARKADDRQVEEVSACVRVMPGVASVGLDSQDY